MTTVTAPVGAAAGWQLNGTAATTATALNLTTAGATGQVGSALFATPLSPDDAFIEFTAAMSGGTSGGSFSLLLLDAAVEDETALGTGDGFGGLRGTAFRFNSVGNKLEIVTALGNPVTDGTVSTTITSPRISSAWVLELVAVAVGVYQVTVWRDGVSVFAGLVSGPDLAMVGFAGTNGTGTDKVTVSEVSIIDGGDGFELPTDDETTPLTRWRLDDGTGTGPDDSAGMNLRVEAGEVSFGYTRSQGLFPVLGAQLPTVTAGPLRAASITTPPIHLHGNDELEQFVNLVSGAPTLRLTADSGLQWWVTLNAEWSVVELDTTQRVTDPRRKVVVSFTVVRPPIGA